MTFDGVTYSVLDIGAGGDSEANSVWFVEAPKRTAFLSDLTFNGMHSYVAGHGPAAAPGGLIGAQRAYLLTLAGHVKELANGRPELTPDEKKELERRMTEYLPNGGLTFLIGMNADPIARELHGLR